MLVTIADLNQVDRAREGIELAKQLSLLYDEYVNTEDDTAPAPPPGPPRPRLAGIHASEFSKCIRQMTYSLLAYPKKSSVNKFWRQRFKVGHAIHDMVQTDYERMAARTRNVERQKTKGREWSLDFEREVQVSQTLQLVAKELRLEGHADGVFTFRQGLFREGEKAPPRLRVLSEIKTESPKEFEKLVRPRDEHIAQAHIYMAALDIPLTWFFYFSKGTQNNTNSEAPWLTVFNPDVWRDCERKCRMGLNFFERKELGPREESIGCQFCSYAWNCQPHILQPGGTLHRDMLRVPKDG